MCPSTFEDEPPPTLIKHLGGTGEKLLAIRLAIETDPDIAGCVFAFLRHPPPRYSATSFVVERCEQVPTPPGHILDLARNALFDFARDRRVAQANADGVLLEA
jgi:hypothetical protein